MGYIHILLLLILNDVLNGFRSFNVNFEGNDYIGIDYGGTIDYIEWDIFEYIIKWSIYSKIKGFVKQDNINYIINELPTCKRRMMEFQTDNGDGGTTLALDKDKLSQLGRDLNTGIENLNKKLSEFKEVINEATQSQQRYQTKLAKCKEQTPVAINENVRLKIIDTLTVVIRIMPLKQFSNEFGLKLLLGKNDESFMLPRVWWHQVAISRENTAEQITKNEIDALIQRKNYQNQQISIHYCLNDNFQDYSNTFITNIDQHYESKITKGISDDQKFCLMEHIVTDYTQLFWYFCSKIVNMKPEQWGNIYLKQKRVWKYVFYENNQRTIYPYEVEEEICPKQPTTRKQGIYFVSSIDGIHIDKKDIEEWCTENINHYVSIWTLEQQSKEIENNVYQNMITYFQWIGFDFERTWILISKPHVVTQDMITNANDRIQYYDDVDVVIFMFVKEIQYISKFKDPLDSSVYIRPYMPMGNEFICLWENSITGAV
mmetsp:Transcript_60315/g.73903  ORF Transcript_60315/g.73903 Transcript_60315/m.73903 type:complete len:487 (+) Transcript_60315:49-1509(+)